MRRAILFAAFLAASLSAAPTRIVDTVKYANNTNASGMARIEWPAFTISGTSVAAGFVQVNIVNGVLDVSLQPTDLATPSGTVYTVRFYLQNSPVATEYWSVPTSASAVNLADVRMAPLSALSGLHDVSTHNDWTQISTPGTNPASGYLRVYAKTGSGVCWLTSAGTETCAGAGAVASVFGRTGTVTAASGDYTASQVTNTPAGSISATTVQAAIDELDNEKAAASHTHAPYEASFTSQTSVSIAGATHGIGRAALTVTCWDAGAPRNLVEPDTVTVDSGSYDVAVTFAVAQSGRCVLR